MPLVFVSGRREDGHCAEPQRDDDAERQRAARSSRHARRRTRFAGDFARCKPSARAAAASAPELHCAQATAASALELHSAQATCRRGMLDSRRVGTWYYSVASSTPAAAAAASSSMSLSAWAAQQMRLQQEVLEERRAGGGSPPAARELWWPAAMA
ncbi:hypothetical protein HU200_004590 [Digitaria exilis]|uniref:Uncharacterized protein n=1 Tax=Digitaria exilis TaxID=1010633 RepID=A0A835FRU3_9POAL|nr:hypothetical protein HU200_004590 [Digitaria exilis]